jgi:hypothetical protein
VLERFDEGEPLVVQCEIVGDAKEWLLSGRRKHKLELKSGEKKVLTFKAMAVRCGFFLLPVLALQNTEPVYLDRAKQIHVRFSHRQANTLKVFYIYIYIYIHNYLYTSTRSDRL